MFNCLTGVPLISLIEIADIYFFFEVVVSYCVMLEFYHCAYKLIVVFYLDQMGQIRGADVDIKSEIFNSYEVEYLWSHYLQYESPVVFIGHTIVIAY